MKKQFSFFAAMLCVAMAASAKVWTVNNNTTITNLPSPGQFTDIQSAIAAATSGDTIYISGSPASYAAFSLTTKKLVFIGAGYNPVNQFGFRSVIIFPTVIDGPSTAGSQLIGLVFNSSVALSTTNNIRINRCHFLQPTSIFIGAAGGSEITNNIIRGEINIGNSQNIVIDNNIIYNGYIYNSNQSSVLVSNNVFHTSSGGTTFISVTNIQFTNNVLINGFPTGCSFCAMNNNMASNSSANFDYSSTNSNGANQVGVTPLYNVTASPNTFSFSNSYVLLPGSPATLAGSDSTDVGITGGLFPFDVVKMAYPPIPQIMLMNMTKSNVPPGAKIQFNVKARTQN